MEEISPWNNTSNAEENLTEVIPTKLSKRHSPIPITLAQVGPESMSPPVTKHKSFLVYRKPTVRQSSATKLLKITFFDGNNIFKATKNRENLHNSLLANPIRPAIPQFMLNLFPRMENENLSKFNRKTVTRQASESLLHRSSLDSNKQEFNSTSKQHNCGRSGCKNCLFGICCSSNSLLKKSRRPRDNFGSLHKESVSWMDFNLFRG